ncbi:YbaK/EbsC family protein [Dokdonia sp.]|uniref:YbaK/EbsC family protein n=1 Tax=Dokdonia sp. TaxID=2024995 RepID=UPI003267423A
MEREKELNDQLLYIDQKMYPDKVKKTITFFEKNKLDFKLSRNKEAFSCVDAAQKRYRDGEVGIPLKDELKTYFGEYKVSKYEKHLILINLSGQDRIDFKKIRSILKISKGIRLASKETMELFNIEYGQVNPFLIHELFYNSKTFNVFGSLTVLFDKDLQIEKSTMMTNAGELSWGIEFSLVNVVYSFSEVIYDKSFIKIIEDEN